MQEAIEQEGARENEAIPMNGKPEVPSDDSQLANKPPLTKQGDREIVQGTSQSLDEAPEEKRRATLAEMDLDRKQETELIKELREIRLQRERERDAQREADEVRRLAELEDEEIAILRERWEFEPEMLTEEDLERLEEADTALWNQKSRNLASAREAARRREVERLQQREEELAARLGDIRRQADQDEIDAAENPEAMLRASVSASGIDSPRRRNDTSGDYGFTWATRK